MDDLSTKNELRYDLMKKNKTKKFKGKGKII
jgi:hypothetical protein